jgi:hypothetical protein
MFEDRVFRRIFGHMRKELLENGEKLYSDKLNKLYSLPDIIKAVKSRRTTWMGHVLHLRDMINTYKIHSENLKRRDH